MVGLVAMEVIWGQISVHPHPDISQLQNSHPDNPQRGHFVIRYSHQPIENYKRSPQPYYEASAKL